MNKFCFVYNFLLFVVREGPHGGHHVQAEAYEDLTQAVNHAQVVKKSGFGKIL
jgi:hypothetical protein